MPRYISRSRIDARKCPRKYYYSYLAGGQGYMEGKKNLDPLGLGIISHKGMETLFKTNDIQAALEAIVKEAEDYRPVGEENAWQLKEWEEVQALSSGQLLGWNRVGHAGFLENHEVLQVEKEIEVPLSPDQILVARTDLVVRDKRNGRLKGLNYKTTASTNDWTRRWMFDVQAWTEGMAIEKDFGEKIGSFEYLGLYKGQKRQGSYPSPFLWGYRTDDEHGTTYYDRYRNGRERFPAWKTATPAGPSQSDWINWLPRETVEKQFIVSLPINRNEDVVEGWTAQVVRWEADAHHIFEAGTEKDHLTFFEQRFSNWNCGGCPFQDVCFQRTTLPELVKSGFLAKRESPITKRDTMLEFTN